MRKAPLVRYRWQFFLQLNAIKEPKYMYFSFIMIPFNFVDIAAVMFKFVFDTLFLMV